jgi:NAD(P)H-dependent FMN reductase
MSTNRPRVLVLICSNRPGALGPAIGQWLIDAITARATRLDVELVPVSLGSLGLPFLDEEEHPSSSVYRHEHTRRWSAIADAADGFIAVTPEYNYGMPATLKNALDYLSAEWAWKPIGFVSYGHTSAGTRAVQHAKQVVTTLRMVPSGATVAIRIGRRAYARRTNSSSRAAGCARTPPATPPASPCSTSWSASRTPCVRCASARGLASCPARCPGPTRDG